MTPALPAIASDDPAGDAARIIVETLRAATAGGSRATFAVSGGTTPFEAFTRLRADDLDWRLVDVFQVDERVAPAGDPARNLTRLDETFLSRLPVVSHPMPVMAGSLAIAAADYAETLPREFDLVQLGLGDDGHTASLVPGDPVLEAATDVAVTEPYKGHRRMTLTFPALDRARNILWIVNGAAKREVLAALLAGEADIPANRVRRDRAVVMSDPAALWR